MYLALQYYARISYLKRQMDAFETLVAEVRACRACADSLPLGPRPVFQASPTARILIASQAPGTKVHASGIPFDDQSGDRLLRQMPDIRLTLLIGSHAQDHVLGKAPMTERVQDFRAHLPAFFPLPHPSWRSRIWAARNPWFEAEILPALRAQVRAALDP